MGQITVTKVPIEGLYVIEPAVHGDSRGYFMETYNQNDMHEAGLDMVFVQDNQSASTKGVLRGLHFQKQYPQGKLVRVIRGGVFDVAVRGLPTDSWFFRIMRSSVINARTFTGRVMKAVLPGTTRPSGFSGRG